MLELIEKGYALDKVKAILKTAALEALKAPLLPPVTRQLPLARQFRLMRFYDLLRLIAWDLLVVRESL